MMNSKINFVGSINGRTYTDEKVFQYALRDALSKGEDIEVSATSTAVDPEPVPQPAAPCQDEFQIAINPDKIAANLEGSDDRSMFVENLKAGMNAVVNSFKEGLNENRVNCDKAHEAFIKEIADINERKQVLNRARYTNRGTLKSKRAEIERLQEECRTLENVIDLQNYTEQAFSALTTSYSSMDQIAVAEINKARAKQAAANLGCKAPACDCGCDIPRYGRPATLDDLLTGFVNMFK